MVDGFYLSLYLSLLTGSAALIGAAIYDMQTAIQKHRRSAHPNRAQFRHRPLISILVMAHNNQNTIEACLKSITSNPYRKYQIIVINNASTDDTKKHVQAFKALHPKTNIKLLSKRRVTPYNQALLDGFKKADGEIIVVLNATSQLARSYLSALSYEFASNPSIGAATADVIPGPYPGLLALGQTFITLGLNQFKKLRSLRYTPQSQLRSGDAFRSVVFKAYVRSRPLLKTRFSSNSVVYEDAPLYKHGFSSNELSSPALFLILPCLMAVAIGYSLYLALSLRTAFFLALSWSAMSLFLLFAVWNSNLRLARKFKLSLLLPVSICLLALAFVAALVRQLVKLTNLLPRLHVLGQAFSKTTAT